MQPIRGSNAVSETRTTLKKFEEIIIWLQDLIKLCENPRHSEITAHMLIKSDEATVKITAKVNNDDCRIYEWKWQSENEL